MLALQTGTRFNLYNSRCFSKNITVILETKSAIRTQSGVSFAEILIFLCFVNRRIR